jgi:DNA polymerase-3 subunit alpha
MGDRPFVHLHCHTHYSLLDGANRIPELVAKCKQNDMSAVAVTDHGNLYGAMELLRESKSAGIKPIIGMEAYIAPNRRSERTTGGCSGKEYAFHLTLLARTGEGVRNLMRLSSKAFLEGYYYRPRIDKEILELHSEGLICLSGCCSSELADLLRFGKTKEADALCDWYVKIFGEDRFFLEIQDNGVSIQHETNAGVIDLAKRKGLPLVATSDAHYLMKEDAKAHDILLCVNMGKTFDDPNRMRFETEDFHVRTPEEMYACMGEYSEALKRTAEIAESVEEFYKSAGIGTRQFPSFQPPESKTPEAYLLELCDEGMKKRYGANPPQDAIDRLAHELGIINRMGFASYFLIVWDFVRFGREAGIPSSARGSACGALVSYLLELSHVCPLKYDLLFERFLDPNRAEAPDIDIDLCQERRYEVIEYVRRKYGEANVAQIGTFGTMAAKAAIKDVGRVLNIPLKLVNQITNLVPKTLNISIEAALKAEPELRKLCADNPDIDRMIGMAQQLEGLARSAGTHAAGVVIADRPLQDLVPLQKLPNKDKDKEAVTTQWDMGNVEKAGLLKMDFLGLRNLTILDRAVRLINSRYPDQPIDLNALPLDDLETYALLQRGETKGVFQLESAGIRDLLIKMKPDVFADIIATNALYRPGPLNGGMVDAYVNRKHHREIPDYPHPVMKEILGETHGVMVYQEQVMRILNRLGGIELSTAYATIKAISKKKTDVIAAGREAFIKGSTEQGLDAAKAKEIFDLIEFFGGYGFNKSHSTAYALVAYHTAYLKAHYPTEFMAALLSSEIDGSERDKLTEHIDDARRMGIEVLPPDVNASEFGFRVSAKGRIHFALSAMKGVGFKAVDAIVEARGKTGEFRSLDDFLERVPPTIVNQSTVETLIKGGAFDSLGARRAQLLAVLPRAMQSSQSALADKKRGQGSLFDSFASATTNVAEEDRFILPDVKELPENEKLAEEKKILGFYFSSHPLSSHQDQIRALATHTVEMLSRVAAKQEVVLGGLLTEIEYRNVSRSRSGLTRMAKLRFEDLTGSVQAMLWPEDLQKNQDLLIEDSVVFVVGTVDSRRDPAELIISKVLPIEQAESVLARGLVLSFEQRVTEERHLRLVGEAIRSFPGGLEVYFEMLGFGACERAIYKAGPMVKARYDTELVSRLRQLLGEQSVRVLGSGGITRSLATTVVEPSTEPQETAWSDPVEEAEMLMTADED